MMKRTFVFLSAAVIVMMICGTTRAANVTAAGSTLDLTPTIDATSAGIGQTVLGTLFWDYENGPQSSGSPDDLVNNQRNNLPDYVTFGAGADLQGTSGGWGYQQVIDDFGGTFESGTLASNAGPGLATLTMGGSSPTELRIGVVIDNLDSIAFVGNDLTVAVGASSVSLDPTANANQMGDIYWFDVAEVAEGDVVSLQTSGATANGWAAGGTIAGVVVAEVPEPGSLMLLGLLLTGAAVAYRRRL